MTDVVLIVVQQCDIERLIKDIQRSRGKNMADSVESHSSHPRRGGKAYVERSAMFSPTQVVQFFVFFSPKVPRSIPL